MNDNIENEKPMNLSAAGTISNVIITTLETSGVADNNVRVEFMDQHGTKNDKYLLQYPDKQIQGIGVYTTLLLALTNSIKVTLKTTGTIDKNGFGYISSVIISTI
ncbi:hypothetical protein [Xenorhabdus szentirmaii]|uniref:Uncharacterized protein n=2 Tax=Xenorhabdus szentirmaii TaxID=290112 RepID=W1IWM8_9GAMM|nr:MULTISPECIES: hypothetical protein [Xenorhabdus]MBD2781563.1 hypothetical protein [Xenorhabdus sp. 38]MBD2793572.1 hypothetical protein [Xenorhabdus sp. CUL]MBD2802010.1 hypothetical protein [Xenorhabdus sp. M]MBD2803676.1 hypothetical protein [Xenorhabdus sp. ZM]PHM35051.1 hypothetical protein Xsze_01504 [Xenorhabdus szentirmaii DSM 16338]